MLFLKETAYWLITPGYSYLLRMLPVPIKLGVDCFEFNNNLIGLIALS